MILAAVPGSASLLLELGATLVALAFLGRLAARFGIPSIPLYLIAGLAVGEGGVFELFTARDFIETGAQLGVILLLLLLGMEFTGDELTASLRDHAPAGALDIILNFIPGVAFGVMLSWDIRAALLLGGITYISSSGIIARLLTDLGNTGNRETPVVLAILVTEDLVMALYLPLMAGLLIGGNAFDIGLEITIAITAVVVALGLAIKFGNRISAAVFHRSDENLLLSLLGIALVVAGIAEHLQASAAVGAFLVGIALNGPAEHAARNILGPLRDLFAAMFFVFFGLQINPADLTPALGVALALALITAASKFATGWWSARRVGIEWPGRLRAGTTLIARGEFSIVIAGIAVADGIESEIGPLAAAYVLILAVAGPLLTRAADPITHLIKRRKKGSQPIAA